MSSYQALFVPMFVGTAIASLIVIGCISYRVIHSGQISKLSNWNGQQNARRIYAMHNELYPGSRLVVIAKILTWLGFASGMLWLYTSYQSQVH